MATQTILLNSYTFLLASVAMVTSSVFLILDGIYDVSADDDLISFNMAPGTDRSMQSSITSMANMAATADIAYDIRCQSESVRVTKHCRVSALGLCPINETQVALLVTDGRLYQLHLHYGRCHGDRLRSFWGKIVNSLSK